MSQQILVNEEWQTEEGTQVFFDKNKTIVDSQSNVYVVGSTINSSGNYDILIAKYNYSGQLLWMQNYNGNGNGQDYGLSVAVDNSYNVFVVGTAYIDTVNNNDLILIKYNSSGVLQWVQTYNGSASGNDYAADVVVDNSSGVFVTGGVLNNNTGLDFITLNFNAGNGFLNWTRTYDAYGLNDGAVRINNGSRLTVMGGVQYNINTWHYAVLVINKSSGVIERTFIYNGGSSNVEKVTALATDADENIYICGAIRDTLAGLNLYAIKLDSTLVVQWEYTYSGLDSLDDVANAIGLDGNGNVYLTGFTTNTYQNKNYITVKLNSSGQQQWANQYNHPSNGEDEATALVVDDNSNVYVTGYSHNGNNFDYFTIKYDADSNMVWAKSFDKMNTNDKANDIAIDENGKIVVTGQSVENSSYSYFTVQYAEYKRILELDNDTTHIRNEIIIKFDPNIVNTTFVDRKGKIIGNIEEFITLNSLIDKMADVLGFSFETGVKLLKVHKNLTTQDTISTTRLGEQIRIPEFWSTFVLLVDESILGTIDVVGLCEKLYDNFFPYIRYANPNAYAVYMGNPPDDTFYNTQFSLNDTMQLDIERAWDYSTGKPFVKVGIYDSGVWDDEDFHINGLDKILHYEYSGQGLTTYQHGTMVTSVIGANRNNSYRIAGIAGGDVNDSTNFGATLYDMRIGILNGIGDVSVDAALDAICEGATQTPTFGLGHHIMNHSWGFKNYWDSAYYYHKSLKDQIEWAFKNNVVTVASRGNYSNPQDTPTSSAFPACYSDDWVINVAALNYSTIDMIYRNSKSCYGSNTDFFAPGEASNIVSIPQGFCHTSAAASHISGLAALMLSYYNNSTSTKNNLATEDVQNLLKMGATNRINASGYYNYKYYPWDYFPPTYDTLYGWGVANAYYSFKLLDTNFYKIIHRDTTFLFDSNNFNYNTETIKINESCDILPIGSHSNTQVFEIDIQIPNNLPAGFQIDSIWVRNSSSNLWGYQGNNPLSPIDSIQIVNYNPTSNTTHIRGYVYNFSSYGFFPINNLDSIKLAFTIYASPAPTGFNNSSLNEFDFNLIPNPASKSVLICINLDVNEFFNLQILDNTGRIIINKIYESTPKSYNLDISNLSTGLYFVNIQTLNSAICKKLIVY